MPYTIKTKDGLTLPDVPDEVAPDSPQIKQRIQQMRAERASAAPKDEPGVIASVAGGLGAGLGKTVLGAQHYVGKGAKMIGADTVGDWLVNDAAAGRQKLDGEIKPYKDAHPIAAGAGELAGEMVATLPVGGALAAPVKAAARVAPAAAPVLAPVAEALASSGMKAGSLTGPAGMAARVAGGAATGGATAALINPGDGLQGAVAGGAIPVVGKAASYAGNAAVDAVRPFFKAGQERIAGKALRGMAADPAAAARNLAQASEIIPGSVPTTAMAAGDDGLAGLQRTLQNLPEFANEMAQRGRASNAARTAALEAVAGNPGKLAAAKAARDAATDPMREAVLSAAGSLDANALAGAIQRMMRDPNNAGATTRAGLQRALSQLSDVAENGLIDARALYEIRKDIGLAMQGKLQGEGGNLRYARGALDRVQSLFDDAIEAAATRVPATGTAVALPGANVARQGAAGAASGARPSWRGYLAKYAEMSQPINQMEVLSDVLRRIQTGTDDGTGRMMLSAAKLNDLIKNEGPDLLKALSPDQIDLLRRLRADLGAQQVAATAGKAPGSNTVQNLASTGALSGLIGGRLASSQPVQNTLGRGVNWLFKNADAQVLDQIGQAMLNPATAAALMDKAVQPTAVDRLFNQPAVRSLVYRAAPALAAQ